jgi:PAS domain S-box-containing protein
VWAALRFTQREIISVLVINAWIVIWGTINHHGPFGSLQLNDALLSAQSFISIMVITKLTLNVSVLERRKTEKILRDTGSVLEVHVKNRTAQLEERNQFVETLLDSSGDCIIVIDKDSRIMDSNQCAEENYKDLNLNTIRGKRIFELDSARMPEFEKSAIQAAFKGEKVKLEKVKASGSELYYEITFIPLNSPDGIYAVMIICRDITHRIQAENEIIEQKIFAELLIESSPYLILAHDKELKLTAWNKMSEEHTGIKKEQVLGKHILDVFPEYQDNKWFTLTQEVITEGKTLHFPKIQFQYKPGWGESFVTPLINSKNEIVGLLSITREITDLINATTALEKKNQDLQNMNEELSSFAYVASHDLQEPLRKIQMFSKRIIETEKDKLSETARDYFDRMNKAANRMQQLIENLLTYSRTKNAERKFEKVSFNDILNEVKEELKDELSLNNATILAGDLCVANINAFQFRQLLYNLISNSLKFASEERDPVIRIQSHIEEGSLLPYPKLEPAKMYCHLIISDNGIGFDPLYNEQIFGLFQRLYGKSEYPGTGIGLAICKKIVENHHGFITAEGRPGEGATFHIYVPLDLQANWP